MEGVPETVLDVTPVEERGVVDDDVAVVDEEEDVRDEEVD